VLDELRKRFRPEFLNRVDETIVFHRLSEDDLKRIVEIQLDRLPSAPIGSPYRAGTHGCGQDPPVQTGYDPAYGARPLKKTIQREIETALGRLILQGEVKDNSLVRVDYDGKTIRLTFDSQKKS